MVKTKPSKKIFFQRVKKFWLIPFALSKNVYIRCRKFLKNIGKRCLKFLKSMGKFLRSAKELFFKKWNFYVGDFSFKRIYRNSEGHIIPLLGGVLALAIFYSINTLMYTHVTENKKTINTLMYTHATENNDNRQIVLRSLIFFIGMLLIAWFVIYQIKKSNLRDDTRKALEEMLIKHYAPYIHTRNSGKIENQDFYYLVYFNASMVSGSLKKYIAYKMTKSLFNPFEIKHIKEKAIKNIGFVIEKQMRKTPTTVKLRFQRQNGIRFYQMIENNKKYDYNILTVLKEGSRSNPKNLVAFRVDIEKNKPPFVVFENLKPKKREQQFWDINARQISYVEYRNDTVELTIIQPNASPSTSPRKITVSLSEWLANRNDLR